MVFFARAAYGANPHLDRNANADNGWGGFQWPIGVPARLLATVTIPGGVEVEVRRELAALVGLMYELADRKYGRRFTRGWTGGYENRAIAGTFTPSNHSRGRAIDNDAQDNPMSVTFQCNIPPALVADWETLGWYWGGRYTGRTDPMHFEYCFTPADVAGHEADARRMLAALNTPADPVTPVEDDMTDQDRELLRQIREIATLAAERSLDATKHAVEARDSGNNAASISSDIRNMLVSIVVPGLAATGTRADPAAIAAMVVDELGDDLAGEVLTALSKRLAA